VMVYFQLCGEDYRWWWRWVQLLDHWFYDDAVLPDPGCFIPAPTIFSYHRIRMQTYFFLASYAFRSKVLVLVKVRKIRDPRSRIRKKFIPDSDPGYGSATLWWWRRSDPEILSGSGLPLNKY
jgi:hypothetical protein